MQCLGAICGAGVVKGFEGNARYELFKGGANFLAPGYTKGDGLGAEIVGTFVLVYTVFSATDAKRNARDSHVPVCLLSIFHISYLPLNKKKKPKFSLIRLVRAILEFGSHSSVSRSSRVLKTLLRGKNTRLTK